MNVWTGGWVGGRTLRRTDARVDSAEFTGCSEGRTLGWTGACVDECSGRRVLGWTDVWVDVRVGAWVVDARMGKRTMGICLGGRKPRRTPVRPWGRPGAPRPARRALPRGGRRGCPGQGSRCRPGWAPLRGRLGRGRGRLPGWAPVRCSCHATGPRACRLGAGQPGDPVPAAPLGELALVLLGRRRGKRLRRGPGSGLPVRWAELRAGAPALRLVRSRGTGSGQPRRQALLRAGAPVLRPALARASVSPPRGRRPPGLTCFDAGRRSDGHGKEGPGVRVGKC